MESDKDQQHKKNTNIILVGTSHVAVESLKKVEQAIDTIKPEIIALELDKNRLFSLLSDEKKRFNFIDFFRLGPKIYILNMIGAMIESRIGKMVNIKPGSEMKLAFELAKKHNSKIALIDQDVRITLKRLTKKITFKEKFNILKDLFKAVFNKSKSIKFDLRKVPDEDIINFLIDNIKERYPNIHKILIEERNKVMANNLINLSERFPGSSIVAVIGAGHKKGIAGLIEKYFDKKKHSDIFV